MTMLDGIRTVFLEALSFADERSRAALVEDWNKECQAVYEYKKQLIAEEHYKAAHDGNGWISVGKPPEVYRDEYGELIPFLVCCKGTVYPFRAVYDGTNWGDGIGRLKVTHWMPLPEAPKGGAE